MALHVANAVLIFDTWPGSGTAITNNGTGGSTYNATANANRSIAAQFQAYTLWKQTTNGDYTTIPKGSGIDNLATGTYEFWFLLNAAGQTQYAELYDKGFDDSALGPTVFIDCTNGYITLRRDTTAGGTGVQFQTANSVISPSTTAWHCLQIAFDWSGSMTNAPTCHLDNVLVSMPLTYNSGGSWSNDSSRNACLGNSTAHANDARWTLSLFRLHNVAFSEAYMNDNYAVDMYRIGKLGMTVPGTTSACGAVIPKVLPVMTVPGTTSACGAVIPKAIKLFTVVPGTSSAAGAVIPKVLPVMAVPGTSSATGAVIPKVIKPLTVVPSTTSQALAPTVHASATVTLTVLEIETAPGIPTVLASVEITPSPIDMETSPLDATAPISIQYITTSVISPEIYIRDPSDIVVWDGSFVYDITLDERSDIKVFGVAQKPDGSPYNLNFAEIDWNVRNKAGDILISRSTTDGSIIIDSPENGSFHFYLSHVDTDFDFEPTIKNPVVLRHEARIKKAGSEYVGIRGRMFVQPSQTGGS